MRNANRQAMQLKRPEPIMDLASLRESPTNRLLTIAIVLWMLYLVTGFRSPLTPISISDENSSSFARQILFAGTGFLAITQLIASKALGALLVIRWPLFFLSGTLILSTLWSQLPSLSLKRSIIFAFGAIALSTLVHSSSQPAKFMLRTVLYFCGTVSLISIILNLVLPDTFTVNPARPGLAGISNHPNTLAPFLSIGLILSLGLTETRRFQMNLRRLMQFALIIGLILTMSMTTIVTTIIGLGLYFAFSLNSYRRGVLQIFVFIFIILFSIVGIDSIKSSFFEATGRDESLSGRDELWKISWTEAKKQPLIGHGFGAFWTEGKGRELVQTWNPRQSHHAYLDVIIDLGVFGLTAVVLLFPIRLIFAWLKFSNNCQATRKKAMSAMMAAAFSYMLTYAFSQSFFLRFDAFPFFILVWITLIFTNQDTQNLQREFPANESPASL